MWAGKSSFFLALFRIVEPSSGSVLIDGKDISNFGLDDVRQRIAIIPQEPVLFKGTLRYNLDPFDLYSDSDVLDAIERARLGSVASGLTMEVGL